MKEARSPQRRGDTEKSEDQHQLEMPTNSYPLFSFFLCVSVAKLGFSSLLELGFDLHNHLHSRVYIQRA
jgi:hypothetical protein